MKVAITADLHLTNPSDRPERYRALEALARDAHGEGVEHLIIAGDLFDASRQNVADFERLCRRPALQKMRLIIIPGNHDPGLTGEMITAPNVRLISEPTLRRLGAQPCLFLPYRPQATMGEALAAFAPRLPANQWLLVAHGDWADGLRLPNPTEPGVYMPLTRRDIENYRPRRVFLGHIHRPFDQPPIHYAGSPCGLDIGETGRRRYLIYDAGSDHLVSRPVESDVIYFDESFLILPVADEAAYLRRQIAERQATWKLRPDEAGKALLRVRVRGYSADRRRLLAILQEAFSPYRLYDEIDISQVSLSRDTEREELANQALAKIEALDWPFGGDEPAQEEVALKALRLIYEQS